MSDAQEFAAMLIIGAAIGRALAMVANVIDGRKAERRSRELEAVMPPHRSKVWPWNRNQ